MTEIETFNQGPLFGEIFISSDEVEGGIENLRDFKGKLISGICGGGKKMFVLEEGQENIGTISTLHMPEFDDYDQTFNSDQQNVMEVNQGLDNKGRIKQICCGNKFNIILNEKGEVYTWGYGEYGVLGHGGTIQIVQPKQIVRLNNKNVVQISCGDTHAMAITAIGDLYVWGAGFQGQLGLGEKIQASSVPLFLPYFYKNPIKKIACGSFHSLAIDSQGKLYSWGEGRFGQLGVKKTVGKFQPTLVTSVPKEVTCISAGYGHTAVITIDKQLWVCGFNQKGQLGLGDRNSRFEMTLVKIDILGNPLPNFVKAACGYYSTLAIDENAKIWSFGGGNIGHKNDLTVDLPRVIKEKTENRKFIEVIANKNMVVLFAVMRTLSIRPNYGPSCGGTIVTLLGTGFTDTSRQSARFTFQKYVFEVGCTFDPQTETFTFTTPNFEDQIEEEVRWPIACKIEVTLDGKIYIPCEQDFLIYSSKIFITQLFPKCASVKGGTTLVLSVNVDDVTAKRMKHLTVGFQPKSKKEQAESKMMLGSKLSVPKGQDPKQISRNNTPIDKKREKESISSKQQLNPLDLNVNDPELEKENWVCVEGIYDKGKISCLIPQINTDSLQFNVDISLNGQQFSNQPQLFRFYDVKIFALKPSNALSEGGTTIRIEGEGFFDTTNKKVLFRSEFGERLIDVIWEKKDRIYQLVVPPLNWIIGNNEGNHEIIERVKAKGVDVSVTLSGVEWIPAGKFYYIDPEVIRISPNPNYDTLNEQAKLQYLNLEEEEIDHLEKCANEAEKIKKAEEIKKLLETEDQEILTGYKKQGQCLNLFVKNAVKSVDFTALFSYNQKGIQTKRVQVLIPEIDDLPTGFHEITIEISMNGNQFSNSKKTFRLLAFDKSMPQEQRVKFEEDELKKMKKGGKK